MRECGRVRRVVLALELAEAARAVGEGVRVSPQVAEHYGQIGGIVAERSRGQRHHRNGRRGDERPALQRPGEERLAAQRSARLERADDFAPDHNGHGARVEQVGTSRSCTGAADDHALHIKRLRRAPEHLLPRARGHVHEEARRGEHLRPAPLEQHPRPHRRREAVQNVRRGGRPEDARLVGHELSALRRLHAVRPEVLGQFGCFLPEGGDLLLAPKHGGDTRDGVAHQAQVGHDRDDRKNHLGLRDGVDVPVADRRDRRKGPRQTLEVARPQRLGVEIDRVVRDPGVARKVPAPRKQVK